MMIACGLPIMKAPGGEVDEIEPFLRVLVVLWGPTDGGRERDLDLDCCGCCWGC